MKHLKITALCLLAAFAFVAVAATSASAAEPEWGRCVKLAKKKGKYNDANCQERNGKLKGKAKEFVPEEKGEFEWLSGAATTCYSVKKKAAKYEDAACTKIQGKVKGKNHEFVPQNKGEYELTAGPKFTGEGGAGVLRASLYVCHLENGAGGSKAPQNRTPHENCLDEEYGFVGLLPTNVECATEHATGEAVGSDEVANVSVRFTGCQVSAGSPATTHGLLAGEIQTNTLKGRLGYIHKATHEVGVLLEPVVAGGQFAEFEALEGELIVHVGVGNPTEGAFYEEAHGAPTGGDGVISPVTPVNQMTHAFTQNYRIETIEPYEAVSCPISHTCPNGSDNAFEEPATDYLNNPSHFEGGPLKALEMYQVNAAGTNGSVWGPAGEEITNVNTVEGQAEIKG